MGTFIPRRNQLYTMSKGIGGGAHQVGNFLQFLQKYCCGELQKPFKISTRRVANMFLLIDAIFDQWQLITFKQMWLWGTPSFPLPCLWPPVHNCSDYQLSVLSLQIQQKRNAYQYLEACKSYIQNGVTGLVYKGWWSVSAFQYTVLAQLII